MGAAEKQTSPLIFEYSDYRLYLKDTYEFLKITTTYFSYRYFSNKAGFKSPNFLKLVIDGDRNLSPTTVEAFNKALGHSPSESRFFKNLVDFCQSKTMAQKAKAGKALIQTREFQKVHQLNPDELKYYTYWYYIPLREIVNLKGFVEDYEWIGRKLSPRLPAHKVKMAIENLLDMGFLNRTSDGQLKPSHGHLKTTPEVQSPFVVQYHRQMMEFAKASIDIFPREKREISGTCISCSPESVEKIKQRVREFRQEIMQLAEQDLDTSEVYQLNFQLFPLTDSTSDGDHS